MSTGAIIAIVVVVIVLIAAGVFFLLPQMRSQRLRRTFGPEYDHAVTRHGDRRAAERELTERESRHAQYELRPLSPQSREKYKQSWSAVQAKFVEAPRQAVAEAERLVNLLVAELGYPAEGYERQVADLSVRHGHSVKHYREAHETGLREDAGTDELRDALIGYRKLFDDLMDRNDNNNGRRQHVARDKEAVER
jgi:hypothetical protein